MATNVSSCEAAPLSYTINGWTTEMTVNMSLTHDLFTPWVWMTVLFVVCGAAAEDAPVVIRELSVTTDHHCEGRVLSSISRWKH